jgi:hypothetical protein
MGYRGLGFAAPKKALSSADFNQRSSDISAIEIRQGTLRKNIMMDKRYVVSLLLMLTWLSGCSSLLPSEHAELRSAFDDYLDTEIRYSQAIPGKTTRSELFALGFDPLTKGNGKMLSFIDIRLMFVQANVPLDYLPDGLMRCLEAKDRCIGYSFEFGKTDTTRVGNFWADAFNFRKKREVQGWAFRAVFVLVDEVLVHKMSNGEPNIRRYDVKRNPLGPLQGAGGFIMDQLQ